MQYVLVVIGVLLVGCNPYPALTHKLPESTQDSASLALRCLATFPEKDTVWKVGKSDTVIQHATDSAQLKAFFAIMDSLQTLLVSTGSLPPDTIIKLFKEKCKPIVKTIHTHSTDTVKVKDLKAEAMLRQALNVGENLRRKLARTEKFIWMFWLLLTFMVLEHIMIIVIFRKKLF